jgi:hypothetical protein
LMDAKIRIIHDDHSGLVFNLWLRFGEFYILSKFF